MGKWMTVAPIRANYKNQYFENNKLYELNGVRLSGMPVWLKESEIIKNLSYPQKQQIHDASFAFIYEYEADSFGKEQKRALDKIQTCNMALWLAKPSPLGFELIINVKYEGNEPIPLGFQPIAHFYCHTRDENNYHKEKDVEMAKNINLKIQNLCRDNSLWMAIRTLQSALTTQIWEIRFILFWIVLEALFGDNIEISYRISQRLAFFLSEKREEAQELFRKVKSGYKWRSLLVHGMRLNRLKKDESAEMLYISECCARNALNKVLSNKKLIEIFIDNKKREEYLDKLVFKQ